LAQREVSKSQYSMVIHLNLKFINYPEETSLGIIDCHADI
jgi:hypothetical protein